MGRKRWQAKMIAMQCDGNFYWHYSSELCAADSVCEMHAKHTLAKCIDARLISNLNARCCWFFYYFLCLALVCFLPVLRVVVCATLLLASIIPVCIGCEWERRRGVSVHWIVFAFVRVHCIALHSWCVWYAICLSVWLKPPPPSSSSPQTSNRDFHSATHESHDDLSQIQKCRALTTRRRDIPSTNIRFLLTLSLTLFHLPLTLSRSNSLVDSGVSSECESLLHANHLFSRLFSSKSAFLPCWTTGKQTATVVQLDPACSVHTHTHTNPTSQSLSHCLLAQTLFCPSLLEQRLWWRDTANESNEWKLHLRFHMILWRVA